MKRKISFILALAILVVSLVPVSLLADNVTPRYNNIASTSTSFRISGDGTATVCVGYFGYTNVTTGATINVTIEKRNLLVFWSDVVNDTFTVSGDEYDNEFTYQLEKTGTYRCTVEYTISGTGGASDVVTFEDTKTYE